MRLTQHGTEIKMCYRVSRNRFSESRDDLTTTAKCCATLPSRAIRMLCAIHHHRVRKTAFNLSKSTTLQSSRSYFNPSHSATQLCVTALRRAAVCTLAANHHQTIGIVTRQRAGWCCSDFTQTINIFVLFSTVPNC